MKATLVIIILTGIVLAACFPVPKSEETSQVQPTSAPVNCGQGNSSEIPAEIASELEDLGFCLDSGEIGWVQPNPIELLNDGTGNTSGTVSWYAGITAPDPVFQDYILGVDIDWGNYSDDNLGGCGIFLRITEDGSEGVAFYTNFLSPHYWDLEHWNSEGIVGSLLKDQGSPFQAGIFSEDIHEGTNHYDLVVIDNTVLVYVNGSPIKRLGGNEVGQESIPDELIEGTLAYFARQDLGTITCTFSDGWVWRLK